MSEEQVEPKKKKPSLITYVKSTAIRRIVKEKGKQLSSGYLRYLDGQVRRMVEKHCDMLGDGPGRLVPEDIEAVQALNQIVQRSRRSGLG